jgi:hypothetical protein
MGLYERLILDKSLTKARFDAFFNQLAKDEELSRLFARDPVGVMRKMNVIWGPVNVSEANRLMFAVLSNGELTKWGRNYQERLEAQHGGTIDPLRLDREEIYRDFIKALVQYMDEELATSLVRMYGQSQIETVIDVSAMVNVRVLSDIHSHAGLQVRVGGLPVMGPPQAQSQALLCSDIGTEAGAEANAMVLCNGPQSDTVAIYDTAVVALAVAVFVVAVTQIDVTPRPQPAFQDVLDRGKLGAMLDSLSRDLQRVAQQHRDSGRLADGRRPLR